MGTEGAFNQANGAGPQVQANDHIRLESSTAGFAASKDQVHSWSKNLSVSKASLDLP